MRQIAARNYFGTFCEIPLLGNGGGGMTGIKEDEEEDKQRIETLKNIKK